MCHTRAPRAARRARARARGGMEEGWIAIGGGPNRAFDASLVRRTSGGMHRERALCMALCDPIRGILPYTQRTPCPVCGVHAC